MPQHLKIDLFVAAYLDSARLLLPKYKEEEEGPTIMFGHAAKVVGDIEVMKRVRPNRVLVDVWGRPLRVVLRRWWRDSQKEFSDKGFAGLSRSAGLGFPATPGAMVKGQVPICYRRGGSEFSAIERWIIRRCFRFGQTRFERLPPPKAILEELADEVLGHMERLALIGFDDGIRAMTKYHAFLIEAYATRGGEGEPASLAEFGGFWGPQDGDWIGTYYRIIERAASLLDQEDRFIRTIVYLPRWLLPEDLTRSAPGVVIRLLDLSRSTVARLEDWAVERALHAGQVSSTTPSELSLAGADNRRYTEASRSVVGAWESVVSHTSFYFGWEDLPDDAAVQWDRLRTAWPFLWHHMRCTAYFVATAVWNGDRHGLEHYLDCLLRWPDRLEHDLEQDYHISKGFVTSDPVEMEWTSVDARIGRLRPGYLDSSEPRGVFACILESAWRDVVWITAGIVLGWLNDRKSSDVLTRLALAQLRASEPASDQEFYGRRAHRTPEHEFNRLFQSVVRMELSGPRWSQEGYAAHIHGLVNFLDLLSERDVIPGRGFTPTTRHDLHDLRLLFTALLLMAINEQEVKRINVTTPDFIDRVEAYFGDDGLSALNSYLADLCQYVREEASRTYIEEMYGRVEDLAYFDSKCGLLLSVAQEHAKEVSQRRDDRIKANVVNLETMAQIEGAAQSALLGGDGGIDVLDQFVIRQAQLAVKSELFRITNVNKGYLVRPPMATPPGNMIEHMAKQVRRRAASLAWRKALNGSERRHLGASTAREYFEAFVNEAEGLRSAGLRPVLLVRGPADPLWLESWLRGPDRARPAEMTIERQRASEVGGSAYVTTINGVHVFRGGLDVGTSLLLPRELIAEIIYGEDEDGRIVHATFKQSEDSSDPWTGYIEFSFRQCVELHDQAEVIEIAYPAEAGYGEDTT